MKNKIIIILTIVLFSCNQNSRDRIINVERPTICILGGTPSTKEILNQVPDSIKDSYNFISFNRPGFGGTNNSKITKQKLIDLAKEAGLEKGDYGVIGISGGAPLAVLLASELDLKHCGIISGMVTNKAYFKYADSTITKNIMKAATQSHQDFYEMVSSFPNIEAIIEQAGAKNEKIAIRASYNELNYILSDELSHSLSEKSISINWWHGDNDKNVNLHSVKEFLKDYKNSELNIIQNAEHNVDLKKYIVRIIQDW